LSIISGPLPGTLEYVETQTATTNAFGIVTLAIGTGTTTGNFYKYKLGEYFSFYTS